MHRFVFKPAVDAVEECVAITSTETYKACHFHFYLNVASDGYEIGVSKIVALDLIPFVCWHFIHELNKTQLTKIMSDPSVMAVAPGTATIPIIIRAILDKVSIPPEAKSHMLDLVDQLAARRRRKKPPSEEGAEAAEDAEEDCLVREQDYLSWP